MNPILNQISKEIDRITSEHLDRVLLLDAQEGEEVLGNVADQPYIQSIWALAHDYDRRSSLIAHAVRFDGPKNREQLIRETNQLEEIEHLVRSLAWIEIKRVLPQALDCESIGLRNGWVVVKCKSSREEMNGVLAALRDRILGGSSAQPPEEKEEQIQ